MKIAPDKIKVFQFNPPLRVLAALETEQEDFRFARPKLKRQVAHERVARYFQRSRNRLHSQLD